MKNNVQNSENQNVSMYSDNQTTIALNQPWQYIWHLKHHVMLKYQCLTNVTRSFKVTL